MINVAKDDAGCHVEFLNCAATRVDYHTQQSTNDDDNAYHNYGRRQRTTMMINKDNVEMGKSWRW